MYLFDASSIVKALKQKRLDVLAGNYTQTLAIYEILNALWKETAVLREGTRLNLDEALKLVEVIAEVLDYMVILSIRGLEKEILKLAVEIRLPVYDSSYITLARRDNLTLVTEDGKLRRTASAIVKTISLDNLEV